MTATTTLYTIGHSNQSADEFVELLTLHGIEVVVDIRSAPYSRWVPHFNKKALQQTIESKDVGYCYLGAALGGRPDPTAQRCLYDDEGRALYYLMAEQAPFGAGIEWLIEQTALSRVAVMCSEEDPTHCHRRLLVGKVLVEEHSLVLQHIRRDGALQSETSVELPGDAPVAQQEIFSESNTINPENPWRSSHPVLRSRRQGRTSGSVSE